MTKCNCPTCKMVERVRRVLPKEASTQDIFHIVRSILRSYRLPSGDAMVMFTSIMASDYGAVVLQEDDLQEETKH